MYYKKTYNIRLTYEEAMCMWVDLYSYENIFIPEFIQLRQALLILLNKAKVSKMVTKGMSGSVS